MDDYIIRLPNNKVLLPRVLQVEAHYELRVWPFPAFVLSRKTEEVQVDYITLDEYDVWRNRHTREQFEANEVREVEPYKALAHWKKEQDLAEERSALATALLGVTTD